jgi:opacity protein-like surface antigen
MKLKALVGLGMLAAPVAATGVAHAQATSKTDKAEGKSYVSVSMATITGGDYSYAVEDIFDVDGEIGDGFLFEAAYGMKFQDNWRGEVAFSWRDHDNATTDWQFGTNQTGPGMSAYTLDAIGYRDFPINSRADFYLGGGVGVATVNLDDGVVTDSNGLGLQLQAIAGVQARIGGNTTVFAEARVRSMWPEIEGGRAGATGEVNDAFDITSTSIGAGVKFGF